MKVKVYQILNTENGWSYIGSTTDSTYRRCQHFWSLKNNRHHCMLLQKDYNKYAEDVFKFSIIEEVAKEYGEVSEEWYMQIYGDKLYNTMRIPHRHSKETVKKIADKNRTWKLEDMKNALKELINKPYISLSNIVEKHNITKYIFSNTIIQRVSNQSILDKEIEELIISYNKSRKPKNYKIIGGVFFKSPDNEIFEVTKSLTLFAKEHNLTESGLSSLKNRKNKTHKGWTLHNEN